MCSGIMPAAIDLLVRSILRTLGRSLWQDRLIPMTLLGACRCLRGLSPAVCCRIGHNRYRRARCTHKAGDLNSSGSLGDIVNELG
jgi:hypothetical protein